LNITKLDVLTGLKEIQIGTHYIIKGQRLPAGYMPSTLSELAEVQVEYEIMPGWTEDISTCQTLRELPTNAQAYLQRIEDLVGVPISWVGVGAGRSEMATKGFTPQ